MTTVLPVPDSTGAMTQRAAAAHGAMGPHEVSYGELKPKIQQLSARLSEGIEPILAETSSEAVAEGRSLEALKKASSVQNADEQTVRTYLAIFMDAMSAINALPKDQHLKELKELHQYLERMQGGKGVKTLVAMGPTIGAEITKISAAIAKKREQALREQLEAAGVPTKTIDDVVRGYLSNWKGFVRPSKDDSDVFREVHFIKGLKIYQDVVSKKLVADIALTDIGAGKMKGAKGVIHIHSDGSVTKMVRYKSVGKAEARKIAYSSDITHEVKVRGELGPIPNLLPIQAVGSYIGKDGKKKTRYIAPKCDGTVAKFIYDASNQFLPEEDKDPSRAYHCCRGVLKALVALHEKGFVHKDLKPQNLLVRGGEGWLADLGFTSTVKEVCRRHGSPVHMAPEILLGPDDQKNNPKMDMFSFGTILLAIYREDLSRRLEDWQAALFGLSDESLTAEEYAEKIGSLQEYLRTGNELTCLIADLIDFNSAKRPDSITTERRLNAALDALEAEDMSEKG